VTAVASGRPVSTPDFVPGAPPPATLVADIWRGIVRENPVMVQFLGMCPTMAVTNTLANGLAMGLATAFVMVGAGLVVSLIRKWVDHEVRITTYIVIIATFVTLADMILAATFPVISKALGPFMPLIVSNCLTLGRAESFAAKVGPMRAAADGFGMGMGFTASLCLLSAIREILGSGSLLGYDLFGPRFEPWVFMVMPPGGFLTLGIALLGLAWIIEMRKRHERAVA
jgi:electron transport complex protein RnfE